VSSLHSAILKITDWNSVTVLLVDFVNRVCSVSSLHSASLKFPDLNNVTVVLVSLN